MRCLGNIPEQLRRTRPRVWSLLISLPALVVLSGCIGAFRVAATPAAAPQFRPEAFFAGRTQGEGVLVRLFKSDRPFSVTGSGHSETDGTFVLDQTIAYADGAVVRRSFRMRRINEQEYTGSLTGSSGVVSARAAGNSFHVRYTMGKPAIRMEQWMFLQSDGRTVLNRATVTVLGIPVARLSETIRR